MSGMRPKKKREDKTKDPGETEKFRKLMETEKRGVPRMEIPPLPEEKARQIKSDTEAGGKTEEDPGSTGNRTQRSHNFR